MNGLQLKILLAVLMFLDHVHQFIPGAPLWMTWLGRTVAPVFMFLVAEGLRHTRDPLAYGKRLLYPGLAMLGINLVLPRLLGDPSGVLRNHILVSLALAVFFVTRMNRERSGEGTLGNRAILGGLFLISLFTEGSFLTIPLVALFYYERRIPVLALWYGVISLLFFPVGQLLSGNPGAALWDSWQWMMIFSLPLIAAYNGLRGPGKQRFFYWFYPVHIYLLYLAGWFLKRGI